MGQCVSTSRDPVEAYHSLSEPFSGPYSLRVGIALTQMSQALRSAQKAAERFVDQARALTAFVADGGDPGFVCGFERAIGVRHV